MIVLLRSINGKYYVCPSFMNTIYTSGTITKGYTAVSFVCKNRIYKKQSSYQIYLFHDELYFIRYSYSRRLPENAASDYTVGFENRGRNVVTLLCTNELNEHQSLFNLYNIIYVYYINIILCCHSHHVSYGVI